MTKVFDPKSALSLVGKQSGGKLTKEQIINAVSMAGQSHPQGFDALMVKIRDDRNALERLIACLPDWLQSVDVRLPASAEAVCMIGIQIATGKPLASQQGRLKTLLKHYSQRGRRAAARVRKFQMLLRKAENDLLGANERETLKLTRYIESMNVAIRRERDGLDKWAAEEAGKTTLCPRCASSGVFNGRQCDDCSGVGSMVATSQDVYRTLRMFGLVSSQRDFVAIHWPLICHCVTWLMAEMSECQREFNAVMREERE